MERPQAEEGKAPEQELIDQAAQSADKLISRLQRDGVGLSDEGRLAVEAVIAAAQRVKEELLTSEQRRTA